MATLLSTPELLVAPQNLKRWTVEDYHRLSELGLLDPSERTELIAGQITLMASKGTPHVTALRLLAQSFDAFLAERSFFVSTQDPIVLDDLSEPEPDLAVLRGSLLDYADRHPRPVDVLLIVEVADSTLQGDCQLKDKLYARAGIVEYWVQDLKNRQLHIFQNPTLRGYSSHLILAVTEQVSPLSFPELSLSLEEIFPPT